MPSDLEASPLAGPRSNGSVTYSNGGTRRLHHRHRRRSPPCLAVALILLATLGVLQLFGQLGAPWTTHARRTFALRIRGRPPSSLVGLSSNDRWMGVPPKVVDRIRSVPTGDVATLFRIMDELTPLDHKPPNCTFTPFHRTRYASLLTGEHASSPILVAFDLLSADNVLPSMIAALYTLLRELGPRRCFVVVYENGSKDATPAFLLILSRLFDTLGVAYSITSDLVASGVVRDFRIQYLANLRNRLLEPLLSPSIRSRYGPQGFEQILFLNDVVFCPADAMEVVWQRLRHGADQACAIDYKELQIKEFAPNYPMLFYDTWVARDMLGLSVRPVYPRA